MTTAGASEARTFGVRPVRGVKTAVWFLSLALATGGMWLVLDNRESGSSDGGTSSLTTSKAVGGVSEPGLRTLQDSDAGYQLKYPEAWTEVSSGETPTASGMDGHVIRISGENAFSVQTFPLERAVETANVGDMRAVTDAILSSPDAKLTVLDVRQVEMAGLPAIYYLYYFPSGKQRGLHAHYFIFDGARMHTLIFQVVPAIDFADYADEFDRVVASFQPMAS